MSALTHDSGTVPEIVARARDRATTVGVVDGAADRSALLGAIGHQLHFPGYYGHNLDALDECLADLSWLPEGPVELVWADADLLAADPDTHQVVLAILESAIDATASGPRPLHVVLAVGTDRAGGVNTA
ncbi:barstar family protein [Pseudonocardia sp. KRD291]|uniref:barstar family protein n=1 Tax=Pseudonocardia sp. KRD291 TaxID=2792007 RepID=UPI001C4A472D|nr:barstar family protein [Pseudonocardia sp. KRD291]MBW0106790.1 barstar family protein [Pseudonocardia sp. KRD291]